MINFRYHLVSLIAVFLALGIGVIMGSAVIDRAIVDRLEEQQRGLREDISEVEQTNDELRQDNRELRETAEQLTEEGSERLLTGTLGDVPVLVVATRGVEDEGFDALLSLLETTGADRQGTLWLTERFALDDEEEVRDLRGALDAPASLSDDNLRRLALTRLSRLLRERTGDIEIDDPSVTTTVPTTEGPDDGATAEDTSVFTALRDVGFLDFDPAEKAPGDTLDLDEGARVVFVSGAASQVPIDSVAVPFAELLVDDRAGVPSMPLLVAENRTDDEGGVEFVTALRAMDDVASRLSTVDNIGDFAGRLASVLALVDLGEGRVGHFGVGPGAQRLLPAPPESPG